MKFLDCGNCNACCTGNLIGTAYGLPFGNGHQCKFLHQDKCSIYIIRPPACKNYQCAWSQGLFVESMKPTNSGILASVEKDNDGKQFLKIIKISKDIKPEIWIYLDNWVKEHNTYYITVGEHNETKPRIWLKKV